jgi:hypothetical protein
MNFDSNGVLTRTTQPVKELRTIKRTILVDSRDRDPTKYVRTAGGSSSSDPGDYVVYLPRPLQNVVSIRLKSAIIAAPQSTNFTDNYILLSIEGLNKIDETAYGANKAGFIDNTFARISNPNITSGTTNNTYTIFYNDNVDEENIVRYTPALGTLDRFHITLKYHGGITSPPAISTGTGTGSAPLDVTSRILNAPIAFGTSENSFTFEVEMLDNGFTDFSSFETRLNPVNYVR